MEEYYLYAQERPQNIFPAHFRMRSRNFKICQEYDQAKQESISNATPTQIDHLEIIATKIYEWYLKNKLEVLEYELSVSGMITNIATLIVSSSKLEQHRAIKLLELARAISPIDWRPLIRKANVELKQQQFEALYDTCKTIDLLMKTHPELDIKTSEHHGYVQLYESIKRNTPKFPLLSLPRDILKVVLGQLRHWADLWAEDVRCLSMVNKQAHAECQKYLMSLYKSCARSVLGHAHAEEIFGVANFQRQNRRTIETQGIRRVIQNNLPYSIKIREELGTSSTRLAAEKYVDKTKLPDLTPESIRAGQPDLREWTRNVRFLTTIMMRMERLPKFFHLETFETAYDRWESLINDPKFVAILASVCLPSIGLNMELVSTANQLFECEPFSPLQGLPKLEKCSFCPGDDEIPVGASKFGGFADLPVEWITDEVPRLILQLNLSEISDDFLGRALLPKDGMLYVLSESSFHGAGGQAYMRYWPGPTSELRRVAPSDDDFKPSATWWNEKMRWLRVHVVQRDPKAPKERLIFFDESNNKGYLIGDCFIWRVARISFQEIFSIPNPGYDDHIVELGTNSANPPNLFDQLWSIIRDFRKKSVTKHFLLGYSTPLQRSYESGFQRRCDTRRFREAFKRVHGKNLESLIDEENTKHQGCRREALLCNMRLLLEIDTDNKLGIMWGDNGLMYSFAPQENLERRRLDDQPFQVEFDWH